MASRSTYTPSTYDPYDFANRRHIGPSPEEMAEMLRVVGAPSLDALIDETVPEDIRDKTPLEFGRPLSERGILDRMRATAAKNGIRRRGPKRGNDSAQFERSGKPMTFG